MFPCRILPGAHTRWEGSVYWADRCSPLTYLTWRPPHLADTFLGRGTSALCHLNTDTYVSSWFPDHRFLSFILVSGVLCPFLRLLPSAPSSGAPVFSPTMGSQPFFFPCITFSLCDLIQTCSFNCGLPH